jgi:type III secretion protein Q
VPFPFALPSVSSGLAALRPGTGGVGAECAAAAARSIGALLGCEVSLSGRPSPGRPSPRAGVGRVAIELAALPGAAALEVEASFVAALVDRMAGGDGRALPATRLTPMEAAALDLLVLAAIDGACAVPRVESALAPRLAGPDLPEPGDTLAVELDLGAGLARGRGRLLLPAEAVRALAVEGAGGPALELRVRASLRSGSALLAEADRQGLEAGDVVVTDGGASALVLPGGARFRGRLDEEGFSVEQEVDMDGRNASIPVEVEVELSRLDVTLGELARLEPGAVLPLGIDRTGRVALVVGGRTLARGELVDVEGAVGVRILELFP